MMLQLILFLSMYWILPLLYFVMKGAGDASNGYSFGVRMKEEWCRDEEMEIIITDYKRQLKRNCVILAVVPFLGFLTGYFSVLITLWMVWILAVIVVPGIPYVMANKRVLALKRQEGWQQEGKEAVLVELKLAGEVRRVRGAAFFLPVAISVAAAAVGIYLAARSGQWAYGGMIVVFAALTPVFYLVARWMDRQKTEVISQDSAVNLNYARAKKHAWKNFWLALLWLNTVYTLSALPVMLSEKVLRIAFLWESAGYTLVSMLLMVWVWQKIVHIENRYVEKRDAAVEENSDDCWIWGMFYCNKKDKRVMVNKRAGIGTTMNMATPLGMGMTIFGAAVLLAIPFFCVWMMLEEFTPIRLAVEEQTLVAEHLRADYEISLADIEGAELLAELPTWSKVSGTGMENLEKGTYHIRNVGDCEVFLNPQNAIFLYFEADGTAYYMSGTDDGMTREIYEAICGE